MTYDEHFILFFSHKILYPNSFGLASSLFVQIDWFLEDDIPIFNNLIHLEVADVNFRSWSNFVTSPQNFPKLETLVTYKV